MSSPTERSLPVDRYSRITGVSEFNLGIQLLSSACRGSHGHCSFPLWREPSRSRRRARLADQTRKARLPQIGRQSQVRVLSCPVEACNLKMGFRRPAMEASRASIFWRHRCGLESPARPSCVLGSRTTFIMLTPGPDSPNGFGDLSLGFKQQLGPTRGGFDVSLIPSVSLPTGANLISSHGYDPTVQVPWSRGLSKNWTVAGQFSVMWPTVGAQRNVTGQSSVYFDRQLTQHLDAYVEYSGAFPERGRPQHVIDFGTAYKISPRQQLDFHCGFGLSSAAPDHFIGFGYSVRFQVIRSR